MNNLQNQNVFVTFQSHKLHLFPFLSLLQTKITDFPATLPYTLTSETPTLKDHIYLRHEKILLSVVNSPYIP